MYIVHCTNNLITQLKYFLPTPYLLVGVYLMMNNLFPGTIYYLTPTPSLMPGKVTNTNTVNNKLYRNFHINNV